MSDRGCPARTPCSSCPYRRDVPSGVWAAEEYEKLPLFDEPETWRQPPAAFFCHQRDGRLCAGWVGVHDMDESFGLRMALASGAISEAAYRAALDYVTPTPLFASGGEAAEHGLRDIEEPGEDAKALARRLQRKLG